MNGNRRRDADPLIAFLLGLRTVRCFCPEPVPQQVIEEVLEVARWSGSAMNLQPWEFVVVWDREVLRDLASVEGYAGHLTGAALGIVLVMAGERAEQETFDEGRLGERISLVAAAHGVGSSVGWFAGSGREAAKRILGIPSERLERTALSLGYPERTPPRGRPTLRQGRKPLADLVHVERYGRRAQYIRE